MRFLADMGVSMRVVAWLRGHGFEVVHLREEGLQKLPDAEIFLKAGRENRVLLTFDLDFGEILARSPQRSPGVILFRLHNATSQHVIARFANFLAIQNTVPTDSVVIIEESRFRVRRFPR